jgi:hypothetical protein
MVKKEGKLHYLYLTARGVEAVFKEAVFPLGKELAMAVMDDGSSRETRSKLVRCTCNDPDSHVRSVKH